VTTLVTGHGDSLGIFLNGAIHHFFNAAVVTQVNYLGATALDDAPHNIYGSIVTVKK
jgi:hypothetical protein